MPGPMGFDTDELRRRALAKWDDGPGGQYSGATDAARDFAGRARQGYDQRSQAFDGDLQNMRDIASGKVSHSREALRQGLMQNMAQQRSMAAGACGGNQIMAARNAQMNASNAASGLAGQQALAGIKERQAAAQSLGQLGLGARGQDLQAALGSNSQALQGYGQMVGIDQENSGGIDWGSAAATYGPMIAMAMSDKRRKKNIAKGNGDAADFLKALKSYSYDYKDEVDGEGRQLGVMAQDLEKTKFGKQLVVETPRGKMVNASKLAGALAASAAHLSERVEALESKK